MIFHLDKCTQQAAVFAKEIKLKGIILIVILLVVNGCKEKQEVQPLKSPIKPKVSNTTTQSPPTPVSLSVSVEGEKKETESNYSYLPIGRRDPFKSLIFGLKEKKSAGLTPLQQRSLGELRVIGIIWSVQGHMAMITTPDGKGFLIKEGILVGPDGGVVRKITEDSIIIEEVYTDYYGRKKSKETVLRLHVKEEGGG